MAAPRPDVAIVGMACRLPGSVSTLESFWNLIQTGVNTWSDVPEDRYNWQAYYQPDSTAPYDGRTNHRGGHFLKDDIKRFDAPFFSISPEEAKAMDPQQRFLLEVAFEAFENAGLTLEQLRGSNTAVYVATFNNDYQQLSRLNVADIPLYSGLGSGDAILANRISYQFDLKGPSLTINTGCSGSLVALHAACEALSLGDTDMVLVAAANLMLLPDTNATMSRLGLLNDDGKSYAFDIRGSGYGRGEGIAAVVLKRIEDACKEHYSTAAIIRQVAVGQDGRTVGITQPSATAQETLIRQAYERAHLDPVETTYIEAHGTGTIAGDAAELQSLARVFGRTCDPVFIGSVKANIGHLESASGIVGLIKAALVLQHAMIPPLADFTELKPGLDHFRGQLEFPTHLLPWPAHLPLRASVNSFGYGGTNAHAILESPAEYFRTRSNNQVHKVGPMSAVHRERCLDVNGNNMFFDGHDSNNDSTNPLYINHQVQIPALHQKWYLLLVSAASETSLSASVENLHRYIAQKNMSSAKLAELSFTINARRSHLNYRTFFLCDSYPQLVESTSTLSSYRRTKPRSPRIPMIFTGQGSQYHTMGWHLYCSSSIFRSSLEKSNAYVRELGFDRSLLDIMFVEDFRDDCDNPGITQTTVTAVQIALVELLKHFRILPDIVVGHSSGEVAAAYAAGILTHRDALRIVFHRGRLISQAVTDGKTIKGAMMAVSVGEHRARRLIDSISDISIACVNSASSTTLSGSAKAIDEALVRLKSTAPDVRCKKLSVNVAYHSPAMLTVAEAYQDAIKDITHSTPREGVSFISSVTGEKVETFAPSYWVQNLVQKVCYKEAIECVMASLSAPKSTESHFVFVEVGPHQILCPLTQQTASTWLRDNGRKEISLEASNFVPTMIRGEDTCQTFLRCIGHLWTLGILNNAICSNLVDMGDMEPLTDLPPYPWDHDKQFWNESRLTRQHLFRRSTPHDLLGSVLSSSTSVRPIWRNNISRSSLPWLEDHVIGDLMIFPASAYISMAIEAIRQHFPQDNSLFHFRDIRVDSPLMLLDSDARVEIQLMLENIKYPPTRNKTWQRFVICSCADGDTFVDNCSGLICVENHDTSEANDGELETIRAFTEREIARIKKVRHRRINALTLYNAFREGGNRYGPSFRAIDYMLLHRDTGFGKLSERPLPQARTVRCTSTSMIHLGTLDSCIHACIPVCFPDIQASSYYVAGIEQLSLFASPSCRDNRDLDLVLVRTSESLTSASCDISVIGSAELVMCARGVTCKRVKSSGEPRELSNCSYVVKWGPDYVVDPAEVKSRSGGDLPQLTDAAALEKAALVHLIDQTILLMTKNVSYKTIMKQELQRFYLWMQQRVTQEQDFSISQQPTNGLEFHIFNVEAEFLTVVLENLAPILSGQMDALQTMQRDNLLARLYTGQIFAPVYDKLKHLVQEMAFKNGALNVLEIGAGTGATAKALFGGLSQEASLDLILSYDYTDISVGYFDQAQADLGHYDVSLRFRQFDMNRSPSDQGFSTDCYDLIIATNALHLAQDLDNTLTYCCQMLRQDGLVALIETAADDDLFANMTFGTLPGWFTGCIEDLKSPLLSAEQWSNALQANCFQHQPSLSFRSASICDCELIVGRNMNLMQSNVSLSRSVLLFSNIPHVHTDLLSIHAVVQECTSSVAVKEIPSSVDPDHIYILLGTHMDPIVSEPSAHFSQVIRLLINARRVIWITTSNSHSSRSTTEGGVVCGLIRTARLENPDIQLVYINVIDLDTNGLSFVHNALRQILESSLGSFDTKETLEAEYLISPDQVLIPRLIPSLPLQQSLHGAVLKETGTDFFNNGYKLDFDYSTLDRPIFRPDLTLTATSDEIKIAVEAWLILAHERSPLQKCRYPSFDIISCVGRVVSNSHSGLPVGEQVCVWGNLEMASHLIASPDQLTRCITKQNGVDQSMLRCVDGILYHVLKHDYNIQGDCHVLVHSNSIRTVSIALKILSLLQARSFLFSNDALENLVDVPFKPDHVLNEYSSFLEQTVLRETNRKGLQIIITTEPRSLPQDLISSLIQSRGVILHFSYSREERQARLPNMPPGVVYRTIEVDTFLRNPPLSFPRSMSEYVQMLQNESLAFPFTYPTCEADDLGSALKSLDSMTLGDGSVFDRTRILSFTSETKVETSSDATRLFHHDATYIIVGGLGGLGMEICKLLIRQNAGVVLLLTRRALNVQQMDEVIEELSTPKCDVRIVQCDPANEEQLARLADEVLPRLPRVRGVVQAAMVLDDVLIKDAAPGRWTYNLRSKVEVTIQMVELFAGKAQLDFFLMLSSAASILGAPGQSSYAASNTFLDQMAHFLDEPDLNLISLSFGGVSDAGALPLHPQLEKNLRYQGLIPINAEEFNNVVEYLLQAATSGKRMKHAVIGFNNASLSGGGNSRLLSTPFFVHLSSHETSNKITHTGATQNLTDLDSIQTYGDAVTQVQQMLLRKISQMTFTDLDDLASNVTLGDIGTDSLMSAGLLNWISSTFKLQLLLPDTLRAHTPLSIAQEITAKSGLFKHLQSSPTDVDQECLQSSLADKEQLGSEQWSPKSRGDIVSMKQPIPYLQQTITRWLRMLSKFTDQDVLQRVKVQAERFASHSGPGYMAHKLLLERYNDTEIDYWLSDLLTKHKYLSQRTPLIPFQNWFVSHSNSAGRSQAERAALITHTVLEWKQAFETGSLEVDELAGKPQSSAMYGWLPNAFTKPGIHQDEIGVRSSNEEVVVLCKGQAFHVVSSCSVAKRLDTLEIAFQQIIDNQHKKATNIYWPGFLSAAPRAQCATLYEQFQHFSVSNQKLIDTIERAAVIICLDDQISLTSYDRLWHFMVGGQHNRWYEKSTQFIVTADGHSATIHQHSMVDGTTALPLQRAIVRAIRKREKSQSKQHSVPSTVKYFQVTDLEFDLPATIQEHIDKLIPDYENCISQCSLSQVSTSIMTGPWLTSRKLHKRCSVNLVIQIANRMCWNSDPSTFETVSMSHFRGGRVDTNQLVSDESIEFCNAIFSASSTFSTVSGISDEIKYDAKEQARLQKLFKTALKVQADSLDQVAAGHGPTTYLLALRWILQDESCNSSNIDTEFLDSQEVTTALFAPVVISSWGENGPSDHAGLIRAPKKSLFIYFIIGSDRITFDLWGNDFDTERYKLCLHEALNIVINLFR